MRQSNGGIRLFTMLLLLYKKIEPINYIEEKIRKQPKKTKLKNVLYFAWRNFQSRFSAGLTKKQLFRN